MNVLIDRHHSDLYNAMQWLFEDRLGLDLYTPLGREWWDAGVWQFGRNYGDDRLVRQFLEGDGWLPEPTRGHWVTFDNHHPMRRIHGVTYAAAQAMDWTYVVATVEDNQPGFARFARDHGAKYVVQVGNTRQFIDGDLGPIILDLAQEFDHRGTFAYREPLQSGRIASMVNLLPLIPEAWAGFAGLSAKLPEYEFRSYGHHCPDGFLDPVDAVAAAMSQADWAYHDKVTGDGFGHVIHNWAAIGRPLIGHARYYEGQRAQPLWIDGVTCIDLDQHSIDEAAEIIRGTSGEKHRQMCESIRSVFDAIYDPEADAEVARTLLG